MRERQNERGSVRERQNERGSVRERQNERGSVRERQNERGSVRERKKLTEKMPKVYAFLQIMECYLQKVVTGMSQ